MDLYLFLANSVVFLHFLFILFVLLGGWIVVRHPRFALLHLPAALWGAWIEYSGGICPLTPLENHLRRLAGEATYRGDFIERYLIPIIYPEGLTRELQLLLGTAVVAINLAFYSLAFRRWLQARIHQDNR